MVSQILEKTNASLVHNENDDGFNNGVSYLMDEEEIASLTPYKNVTDLTKTEKSLKSREEHKNSIAIMKKRKLNSKNPKYWDKSQVTGPVIKERKLMKEGNGFKMYFVYYK